MNMTQKPPLGCEKSFDEDMHPPEMLTNETLDSSTPRTSPDTLNVTFSPESAGGQKLLGSLIGLVIGLSGQEAVPASPSASPEKGSPKKIAGTYGPNSGDSSPSAALQQSLESRLRVLLGVNGSIEYALTWKHWDMKSGPPICALRASARRTSDSGFTGWPTPNTPSGGRSMSPDKMSSTGQTLDGRKHTVSLEHVAKFAELASGPTSTSSIASMANRGALNPEHSRWLMGFPEEWDSCGATAMQSFRKSRRSS